ncbi:putative membrane protein [Desulfosporosinus sp. OT]|nr:putative membrane protein [Desulfosporosinus sp. OT]
MDLKLKDFCRITIWHSSLALFFLYLIGKSDKTYYMFLPLVGMLFIIPCLIFWRMGVRHYKTTGS